MATTLKAMRRQELHPAQRGNLASGPAIAAPDHEEHVQLVEADQRFQAALEHAIATGSERIEAVGYGATEAAHHAFPVRRLRLGLQPAIQ